MLATFARDREGPDVHGVAMPSVRGPSECLVAQATHPSPEPLMPFYRNFEIAQAIGEPMWQPGWSKGEAHAAFWYRYRDRQRTEDGRFDPLALAPIADTMPPALVRRLGPEHPRLLAPSLDLTMYFLAPTQSEWILVESFAERARAWARRLLREPLGRKRPARRASHAIDDAPPLQSQSRPRLIAPDRAS